MKTHTILTRFALMFVIAWFVALIVSTPFATRTAHARQPPAQETPLNEAQDQDEPSGEMDALDNTGSDEHVEVSQSQQVAVSQPQQEEGILSWLGFVDFTVIIRSLLLVGIPGMLGGIVAGQFRPAEKISILTNAVAGLLGAYAIFLMIPGDFDIKISPTLAIEFVDLLEIFGVAAVGGFGGKAILAKALENALASQLDEVSAQQKKQSAAIESAHAQQNKQSAAIESAHEAEKAAQRVLQDDEMALKDFAKLAKIFKEAPAAVVGKIFYSAREQRKDNEAPLIDPDGVGVNLAVWENPAALKLHRRKIEHTKTVFRALIECDTKNVFHRNHAQLSYAITSLVEPNWKEAQTQIRLAIEKRNKADEAQHYRIYELHLACILIETAKEAGTLDTLDRKPIAELLSKAAKDRTLVARITAALGYVDELKPPKAEGPSLDAPRFERYASLLHFAATYKQAAKELLEKIDAPGH